MRRLQSVHEETAVNGGYLELIAATDSCTVFQYLFCICKLNSLLSAIILGQFVIERNVSVLFDSELDGGSCDALLSVEEKEKLDIFI
jgi:hypothetical protein